MKFSINPQTGNQVASFEAKLVSISEKTLENTNGIGYRPCTVEYFNVKHEKVRASAIMYESNFQKGIEINQHYLAQAELTEKGVLIKVSHLSGNAERPSADDFGFGSNTTTLAPSIQASAKAALENAAV